MAFQLKQDELINNNFKIKKMLGEGGMSVVYQAVDIDKKRDVALKFLKQGVTSSYVEDVIRFKREAEAVSKLDHPNVIKLYGAGEYNNTPYLAEEMLDGKSLSEYLQQGKIFTLNETVQIIAQVTEALDYVHKRRIIHRDLKPGNIVVAKKADKYSVTLLDFGIAHVMELSRIKEVTQIVGTFGYMSPEATGIVNKQIDERSDFYSLGVVFYQLLSKELPFKSTEVNKLLHEQVAVEPKKLREVNREVPKILEEIVVKLLNKEPELRYQSAIGLLHDLERFLKGEKDFIIAEKDQKTKLTYQTRLVGREEEMDILKSAFQGAKESEGNICLIGGEPGVGKSRLVEEMREYLYEQGYEGGGLFIQGRCLNQENKIPYQPFRDSINEYIQKLEKMKENERKKEIERLKEAVGDLGEIIIRLNPHMKQILGDVSPLVSLDSERENQRFLMVASDFFCHLTEKGKLSVLFLDDLQWADEGSLSLLDEISWKVNSANLFIIGTYRDDEVGEDHSLQKIMKKSGNEKSSISNIKLRKFNHERLNKMVAGVLGEQPGKAVELTAYVLDKSGGNPFFAITILRELVEQKALIWKNGYWKEDWEKINSIRISNNIIDLVIKRIDDLTEDQNKLLCVSSIIGREFKVDLLYDLLEFEEEKTIRLIDELMMVQLIEKSKEKGKVIFVHDRIREAFLEKIGKAESKKIHLEIANAMETSHRDRIDDVVFDLAYHFTEGGDKERSLKYVLPAARKARSNHANDEAIKYYKIGIGLLEEKGERSGEDWMQAEEELADVYLSKGNYDETIKIGETLLPLLKTIDRKTDVYKKIVSAWRKKGDWKRCEKVATKGLALLGEKLPLTNSQVAGGILKNFVFHILIGLFPILFMKRKGGITEKKYKDIFGYYNDITWMYVLSDVIKFIHSTLRMTNLGETKLGKSNELSTGYGMYASLFMAIPVFMISKKYHEKALKLKRELADEWGTAQELQIYSAYYQWRGRYQKSLELGNESAVMYRKMGDMWELCMTLQILGHNHYFRGDYDKALDVFLKFRDLATQIVDNYSISDGNGWLALIYIETGDIAKAEKCCLDCIALSEREKIWFIVCFGWMNLGYVEIVKGNPETAIKHLDRSMKIYKENNFLKNYTLHLFSYLVEAHILDYKRQFGNDENKKDSKKRRQKLKVIRKACRSVLFETRFWPNRYGAALRVTGMYHAIAGHRAKAIKCFKRSIEQTLALDRKYELGKSYYEFGNFLSSIGRCEKAKEKWQEAHKVFTEIGAKIYIKKCRDLLGIEIKDEIAEGESKVTSQDRLKTERRMNTVLETSRYLSSILDLDELLDKIMTSTIELVGAERGALFLYPDADENKPHKLEIKVLQDVKGGTGTDTFQVSEKTLANMEADMKPMIISDALKDHELKTRASVVRTGLKSVLCSPIMIKGELLGVIYLDSHLVSGLFTEDDLQVLELLASQSAVSIKNARLYTKSIAKERMERDLQIGGEIQKYFLPDKIEEIKDININAYYSPAEFIGGDYYDVVQMGKDKYGIIIVDISGHGSSAAIVMSVISFIFHSVIDKVKTTAELVDILSKRLLQRLKAEKYATGTFIIYDAKTGELEYTNAGHQDPILYNKKEGKVQELGEGKGVPIGVFEEAKYTTGKYKLKKDDILLLLTDGIHESMNSSRQQFTLEKVRKLLLKNASNLPKEINESIIQEVNIFRGNLTQSDDITLITMKKTA